ncbi:Hypothetical protein FKW44_021429, partial [Caligus rogercresseyi]
RTSLRYNELKFVILRIPNFVELAEQASYIANLSSLYLRLPNPNYELLRIMRFELM